MSYELSANFGLPLFGMVTATVANIDISSAFAMNTSGIAWLVRFIAPVVLSNGTLVCYAFFPASSGLGSPTDVRAAVWNAAQGADDPDRPNVGGAALATSAAVDCSSYVNQAEGSWVAFTITGVTLTQGQTYYIIIDNRTGTPGSHYPTFAYRGSIVGPQNSSASSIPFGTGYTAVGFSSLDPTMGTVPAAVVKIGTTLLGNPWAATATHASNANDRGNRYQFSEDVVISGITSIGLSSSALSGFEVNQAADGVNVATAVLNTGDLFRRLRAGGGRVTPITLVAGVAYDIVVTYSANTAGTIYTMGQTSPPADVLACRMPNLLYVDGDTPGSYATDAAKMISLMPIIDNMPLIDTPVAGNVTEDDTVRGVTGIYHEPTAAEVQSGVQFGAGGTEYTGTLSAGGGLLNHPGMTGGMNA